MKSGLLVLVLFILCGCVSDAPDFRRISSRLPFIKQFGMLTNPLGSSTTSGNDVCDDVVVDRYENIYCSGYTTSNFGEASTGFFDAYVMKMDKTGKVLWVRQLGAQSALVPDQGFERCWQLAVDRDLNVYCGGDVDANFQAGLPGVLYTAAPYGGTDIFVMKLNSQGEIQWRGQYGSPGNEGCYNMIVAHDGYIYCSAGTSGEFESGAGAGNGDAYILKINPADGSQIWVRQLGPNTIASRMGMDASGFDNCGGLAEDTAGNIWCAGRTNKLVTASTTTDLFLWKISSTGVTTVLKQYSSPEYPWALDSSETGTDIMFWNGSLFVGGSTTGTFLDTNDTSLTSDAIVWKIHPRTLEPDWINQVGEDDVGDENNSKGEFCAEIAVNSRGEVFCGGQTRGNFGDANADATLATNDLFVIKFGAHGTVDHILKFGASAEAITGKNYSADDQFGGLFLDSSDNLYVVGHTYVDFNEPKNGNIDALIFRLGPDLNISDLSP